MLRSLRCTINSCDFCLTSGVKGSRSILPLKVTKYVFVKKCSNFVTVWYVDLFLYYRYKYWFAKYIDIDCNTIVNLLLINIKILTEGTVNIQYHCVAQWYTWNKWALPRGCTERVRTRCDCGMARIIAKLSSKTLNTEIFYAVSMSKQKRNRQELIPHIKFFWASATSHILQFCIDPTTHQKNIFKTPTIHVKTIVLKSQGGTYIFGEQPLPSQKVSSAFPAK